MTVLKWWQKAVFYQIYPRSFADGNGDGIGDIPGILDKLDYLKDLGVDAVWLSPHYPSPQVDCGYDISDYCSVAPEYGTMDDFRRLLDGLHQRGMRLVLDLVLNHTSDQHAWFRDSRSSTDNPKRDWYIWRKGERGGPPNDWFSTFGGPAWELDEATGEYYYHFFFKEQPDLNWRNPQVKQAMFDMVRFWLDMGVDGFRLDAIGTVYEDPAWRDHHLDYGLDELYVLDRQARSAEERAEVARKWDELFTGQHDLPEVHDLMRDLRKLVDEYDDRVLIGETDDIAFYGSGNDELHLNFNFPLMRAPYLNAAHVRANQRQRLAALPKGAWPCNTLGNHDAPRMFSQFGDGIHNGQIAVLNLALLLSLKGTPFLYNGEEIGMSDLLILDPSRFRDPLSLQGMQMDMRLAGADYDEAVRRGAQRGRDKCRTPLQWANAENGGFSPAGVQTWLPVNPDYAQGVNVADQQRQPGSLWHTYRHLLHLRREQPALLEGEYEEWTEGAPDCLLFTRACSAQTVLAAFNPTAQAKRIRLNRPVRVRRALFSSAGVERADSKLEELNLQPFEALYLDLDLN